MAGKSTLRKLNIESQSFLFRVTRIDAENVSLKIWPAGTVSRKNYIQVSVPFDDVWLKLQEIAASQPEDRASTDARPVTPEMVKKIIESAASMGWDTKSEKQSMHFNWKDGQLHEMKP